MHDTNHTLIWAPITNNYFKWSKRPEIFLCVVVWKQTFPKSPHPFTSRVCSRLQSSDDQTVQSVCKKLIYLLIMNNFWGKKPYVYLFSWIVFRPDQFVLSQVNIQQISTILYFTWTQMYMFIQHPSRAQIHGSPYTAKFCAYDHHSRLLCKQHICASCVSE